ncbi:hypothetical protein IEQ34_019999 [Dendrobium chrysotoxum]|uniref:Uncharacterized protein n=1 Tax=Dendrobium chrysotoxum TaxID=161865 RepID=A0AAV7FSR7_DENCH|nr:hypothetical protein IEQ34_019999 [Dendrobium chrysotoxum]
MTWEDEIIGTDVASAGLHISECIGRDAASQLDLEEALEASRYTSHPYSSQPKEVPLSSCFPFWRRSLDFEIQED